MDSPVLENMLNDVDAVIFDLDGTLADSMWIWLDIDHDFFEKKGMEFPEYLNDEIEGLGFTETAVYFKEKFHLTESIDEIKQGWNDMALEKYRNETPLKPGAVEFLGILRERGIKTGIATSSSQMLVDAFLKARGIEDMIDAVTTVCDVSRGKPDPQVYLVTAEKLGVPPERCLVFEDVPMGILAGENAGMRVCAVDDVYAEHLKEKKEELADYSIRDFTELLV